MKNEGKSSRILTFDLLRGYFILSLIINHLQRFPNGLDFITMRGLLFASAAEGFFIVSGIILGIVRGAKLKAKPFNEAAKLLLLRSFELYVWSVALTIIFTIIGWYFLDAERLKPGIMSQSSSTWYVLWESFSLQYVYGWADFLRLYAVYLLAAPLALLALRHNLWWFVLVVSGGVWFTFPDSIILRWQILFFYGFVAGYHWEGITLWFKLKKSILKSGLFYTLTSIALVTFVVNAVIVFGPKIIDLGFLQQLNSSVSPYFDKHTMGLGRLLLTTLWFSAAFLVIRRYEHIIVKYLGWLLLLFGQNALYVYILHSFIIFGLDVLLPERQIVINTTISFIAIVVIWILTKKQWLYSVIPR